MPRPPLSRSLVLSLPRAAEVRTLTLQQSDNIPPSDNAINEAEFTYNTQHAALRFSARRGVRRAKERRSASAGSEEALQRDSH